MNIKIPHKRDLLIYRKNHKNLKGTEKVKCKVKCKIKIDYYAESENASELLLFRSVGGVARSVLI